MAYCTVDDVRAVLSAQGQADGASAASLPDAELQGAVDDAAAEVDSRLAVRYDVPFDDDRLGAARPVPTVVKNVTRDIAAYKATLTYRRGAPIDQQDPAVLRFSAATKLLTSLQNGSATLRFDTSPSTDEAVEVTGSVENLNAGTLFDPHDLGLGPRLVRGGTRWPYSTY